MKKLLLILAAGALLLAACAPPQLGDAVKTRAATAGCDHPGGPDNEWNLQKMIEVECVQLSAGQRLTITARADGYWHDLGWLRTTDSVGRIFWVDQRTLVPDD